MLRLDSQTTFGTSFWTTFRTKPELRGPRQAATAVRAKASLCGCEGQAPCRSFIHQASSVIYTSIMKRVGPPSSSVSEGCALAFSSHRLLGSCHRNCFDPHYLSPRWLTMPGLTRMPMPFRRGRLSCPWAGSCAGFTVQLGLGASLGQYLWHLPNFVSGFH